MWVQTGLFGNVERPLKAGKNGNGTGTVHSRSKPAPWDGICVESCWMAREEKCACHCGGANHGKGLTSEYEKLEDFTEGERRLRK